MFRRRRRANDFAEEIQAHLELEADELKDEGLNEEEAHRRAKIAFGNVASGAGTVSFETPGVMARQPHTRFQVCASPDGEKSWVRRHGRSGAGFGNGRKRGDLCIRGRSAARTASLCKSQSPHVRE